MSPWVRIDDTMPDDPRWDDIGADALGLHVAALAYCNRNLTDGVLPRSKALRLLPLSDPEVVVNGLARVGFWQLEGESVRLVDGDADKQPSKADVLADREAERTRKATTRERRKLHAAGDHSTCRTDYCPLGALSPRDVSRNPRHSGTDSGSPDPTRPVPTPREGEGREGLTPALADVAPVGVAPSSRRPRMTVRVEQ